MPYTGGGQKPECDTAGPGILVLPEFDSGRVPIRQHHPGPAQAPTSANRSVVWPWVNISSKTLTIRLNYVPRTLLGSAVMPGLQTAADHAVSALHSCLVMPVRPLENHCGVLSVIAERSRPAKCDAGLGLCTPSVLQPPGRPGLGHSGATGRMGLERHKGSPDSSAIVPAVASAGVRQATGACGEILGRSTPVCTCRL